MKRSVVKSLANNHFIFTRFFIAKAPLNDIFNTHLVKTSYKFGIFVSDNEKPNKYL